MKYRKRRHNKRNAYRKKILIILFVCLLLLLALAGVSFNIKKNDLRLSGISLYEQGQYTEALEMLDEALLKWAPFSGAQDRDILFYKGSCYLMQGEFSQAVLCYDTLAQGGGDEDSIEEYRQIATGLSAYSAGSYDEAVELLTPCAESGCYVLYLYIGSCYLEQGDGEKMLAAFDAYAGNGNAPDSAFLHGELAAYYMELGDYENAMDQIEAGLLAGDGYQRELRWEQVCCLEYMLDFNGAYEKMMCFAQDYTLSDAEQKEWDFLQTRYTEAGEAEDDGTEAISISEED